LVGDVYQAVVLETYRPPVRVGYRIEQVGERDHAVARALRQAYPFLSLLLVVLYHVQRFLQIVYLVIAEPVVLQPLYRVFIESVLCHLHHPSRESAPVTRRTPMHVAPLSRYGCAHFTVSTAAMSRCAHLVSPTNSRRKAAAVREPASGSSEMF